MSDYRRAVLCTSSRLCFSASSSAARDLLDDTRCTPTLSDSRLRCVGLQLASVTHCCQRASSVNSLYVLSSRILSVLAHFEVI